ncbi:hypothetical protein Btru_015019 [Bulinus truncatus]|nr:hypothetical protein Btru_015019 [Bulinus truncatus]
MQRASVRDAQVDLSITTTNDLHFVRLTQEEKKKENRAAIKSKPKGGPNAGYASGNCDFLLQHPSQVRGSPHDDGNSVTSGETATSDSGRGGSEDDIPLPPIAECSPELNSE